jgi:hypothetical protein
MPYNRVVEFIEASAFTRYVYEYLSEDEYVGLQIYLSRHPEAGKVVSGTGGFEKSVGRSRARVKVEACG